MVKMKKIGISYGTALGNTRKIAEKTWEMFGIEKAGLLNIKNAGQSDFELYENLIFGTSTIEVWL